MRFVALATDYDGTLAHDGKVTEEMVRGMRRCRASGRKLLLVTGRRMESLASVFDDLRLFDAIVAENGALVYFPVSGQQELLAAPVPDQLVDALRERGIDDLEVGQAIIGTWHPNETAALEVIRDLDLEYQIVFNKGAVMLMPSGTNKATGLAHALHEFGISPYNAAGIGDAENDNQFLESCGLSVAVANAIPRLKAAADITTQGSYGYGVLEAIDLVLDEEALSQATFPRHRWTIHSATGAGLSLPLRGSVLLVCGPSYSGKSNIVSRAIDELMRRGMQCCIVDPEGDYGYCRCAHLGSSERRPEPATITGILQDPEESVVVNLLGVPGWERQNWFRELLGELHSLHASQGRPHWLVVDEAHHVLYEPVPFADVLRARPFDSAVLVTVGPDELAANVLADITHVIALGPDQESAIASIAHQRGIQLPDFPGAGAEELAMYWAVGAPTTQRFQPLPPRSGRVRHARKYSEADLGDQRSFHFRGAEGMGTEVAHNLDRFVELAGSVDDSTWHYHLGRGDYSRWFRECIHDPELAERVRSIEEAGDGGYESRQAVQRLIAERYGPPR